MTDDLHTYAGLYALDAIDGALLQEFEQHVAACAACQQEVREFRATADRMATTVAFLPPPSLRTSVLSAIGDVRQEAPTVVVRPLRRSPKWLAPLAIAAALVLAFGIVRTATTRSNTLTAASVINAKDVREVVLTAPGGVQTKAYVSVSKDRVVVTADGMEPAKDGKSYQLWLIGSSGPPEPAGFMEPSAGGKHVAVLLNGKLSGHQKVAITVEPAGGNPQPTSTPIVIGDI